MEFPSSLLLFLLLLFFNAIPSLAGAPPRPSLGPRASSLFLSAHNSGREDVGVAPLSWNSKLSHEARQFAWQHRRKNGCDYPSAVPGLPYGENQAWASDPISPAGVVALWTEGKMYYDHSTNTCREGYNCDMYTQVVWRNTTELGCAQVQCGFRKTATLAVCYYFPPGNVAGESPY